MKAHQLLALKYEPVRVKPN